ncbi:hypothetical protein [Klebsiella phage vB_KshKPC-M]|nr:hypothetical protein [Klebsiella phage vB_KshKPC-M]
MYSRKFAWNTARAKPRGVMERSILVLSDLPPKNFQAQKKFTPSTPSGGGSRFGSTKPFPCHMHVFFVQLSQWGILGCHTGSFGETQPPKSRGRKEKSGLRHSDDNFPTGFSTIQGQPYLLPNCSTIFASSAADRTSLSSLTCLIPLCANSVHDGKAKMKSGSGMPRIDRFTSKSLSIQMLTYWILGRTIRMHILRGRRSRHRSNTPCIPGWPTAGPGCLSRRTCSKEPFL